ncbi:MAG: universal stress protein [Saprospiraceae bacterium]
MNRILVPIDFTETAANALQYASELSIHNRKFLTLFYCYPAQEHSRKYDFGEQNYEDRLQQMLIDFYKKHVSEEKGKTRFLTRMGTIVNEITLISARYSMIILSGNNFESTLQRWISSRVANIASLAKCPVLIIPKIANYDSWTNVWHFKRKDNEPSIVNQWIEKEQFNPFSIKVKTLKQTSFTSIIWESFVKYIKAPKEELRQAILDENSSERINLILLVSHFKDTFRKFLDDEVMQIIFQFGIPVLVFQAGKHKTIKPQ